MHQIKRDNSLSYDQRHTAVTNMKHFESGLEKEEEGRGPADVQHHCYADDTLLYVPLKSTYHTSTAQFKACLSDINCWTSYNFLKLNDVKTEITLFATPNSC